MFANSVELVYKTKNQLKQPLENTRTLLLLLLEMQFDTFVIKGEQ